MHKYVFKNTIFAFQSVFNSYSHSITLTTKTFFQSFCQLWRLYQTNSWYIGDSMCWQQWYLHWRKGRTCWSFLCKEKNACFCITWCFLWYSHHCRYSTWGKSFELSVYELPNLSVLIEHVPVDKSPLFDRNPISCQLLPVYYPYEF